MAHKKYSKQLANKKKEERKTAHVKVFLLLTSAGNKCRAQKHTKSSCKWKEWRKQAADGKRERERGSERQRGWASEKKAKLLICLCAVGYFCALPRTTFPSLCLSFLLSSSACCFCCLPTFFFFIHFDCLTPSSVKLAPQKIKYLSQASSAGRTPTCCGPWGVCVIIWLCGNCY